jgi:GTP-binding protein LepA
METEQKLIRNFAIIAHIDHGKSTLADRLIGICEGLSPNEMRDQVLDSMPLEKEKGITIKAQTARLTYTANNNQKYQFNLIDTPGHVDFAYEVSRSLAACEGSILLIDATQGIQAQTLANVYQAIDNNHEILPVLNKIDMPSSCPELIIEEIKDIIGIDTSNTVLISAKTGQGVKELMEAIVQWLPPPQKDNHPFLRALIIDSWYDQYLGVVVLIRVVSGILKVGMQIKLFSTGSTYTIDKVGFFSPKKQFTNILSAGEIGFLVAKIKQISDCKVGDTIHDVRDVNPIALKGFKEQNPHVFCGLYPREKELFPQLQDCLAKLKLNDSSLKFEQQTSAALGHGFRCGFLGLLHLEIIQERIAREFDLDVVATAPSVNYKVCLNNGDILDIHDPASLPDLSSIKEILEPWVLATIITPQEFLGNILQLCTEKRGKQVSTSYSGQRVILAYKIPLNEVVLNFYNRVKALSKGFASLDWEFSEYVVGDLVKLNVLIAGEPVDALCSMVHRQHAERRGRELCDKLKDLIPRHLFQIAIQAAIGGRIVARETISAMRKNVLSKCYGGDISRKRKLLEKQKAGKKKMQMIGNVNVPKSVFIEALKID